MEDRPCESVDLSFMYLIAADLDCQDSACHLPRQFTLLSGDTLRNRTGVARRRRLLGGAVRDRMPVAESARYAGQL